MVAGLVSDLPPSLLSFSSSVKFVNLTCAKLALSAEQFNRLLFRCPALVDLTIDTCKSAPTPGQTRDDTGNQGPAEQTGLGQSSPLLALVRGTLEVLLHCPPVAFPALCSLVLVGDCGALMGRGSIWRAIGATCPALTSLTINESFVWQRIRHLPGQERESRPLTPRLTDESLLAIAELPLSKIAIRGCIGISPNGILALGNKSIAGFEFKSPFPVSPLRTFADAICAVVRSNPVESLTLSDCTRFYEYGTPPSMGTPDYGLSSSAFCIAPVSDRYF